MKRRVQEEMVEEEKGAGGEGYKKVSVQEGKGAGGEGRKKRRVHTQKDAGNCTMTN